MTKNIFSGNIDSDYLIFLATNKASIKTFCTLIDLTLLKYFLYCIGISSAQTSRITRHELKDYNGSLHCV